MKFLTVIPHYNHARTLKSVAQDVLRYMTDATVFDDGSDINPAPLLEGIPVSFIRFEKNRGKGAVILDAARYAKARGFTHIITIDADGQHNAADIPLLIKAARQNPHALIIGARRFNKKQVPFSSRFGRKFGGFWVHLQTGKKVSDIQSGYRCYPVEMLLCQRFWCKRYSFEVEAAVKALWSGFGVQEVPVGVIYPPNRISHFSVFQDNFRLSILNTYLTVRAMLPIPHRQYAPNKTTGEPVKRGYWEVMIENLKQPDSITKNAFSAAWGIFCGSIALPAVRQVMLFFGAGWWNLNKILSISFEKFCIGPIVPALCIEAGYFLRYGHFLTEFNMTTLGRQFLQRVWEWVLGSLIIAPVLAAVTFGGVWIIGLMLHRSLREHA
ncbi:MAG: glycosyltransferase family 2 protein [Candidatus Avelusimicrobium sp.]|uniref:glycosyltransferase family 2 protein n=1 Tax=Candidatus Avelusimicrobium sp. TaxID=3048833 RepID=UPI003EFBABD6